MNTAEIFQLAIELKTPVEREAYLAKAFGDDAGLLAKGESLLKSHDEAGSFLEQSLFAAKTLDLLHWINASARSSGSTSSCRNRRRWHGWRLFIS